MPLNAQAGQIILADHSLYLPLQAIKTADDTPMNSNTTLANDGHLFVAMEANVNYNFRLDLLYLTPAAADIKIGWTFPAGTTMNWGGLAYNTSEVFVTFGGLIETTVPAFGGAAGDLAAQLFGTISVGGTAGTLRLQKAQNTSNAGSTITREGSSLVLLKV